MMALSMPFRGIKTLGEAKITQSAVARARIVQKVCRLDVTVHDTVAVNEIDGAYDVGEVETTILGRECSVCQIVAEGSALAQFQGEVEIASVTKGVD